VHFKRKAQKKYEFGCKTSIVLTHKEGLALDIKAIHGNPYDGHTLKKALDEAQANTQIKIDTAFVDKGYRGHKVEDKEIFISGQKKGCKQMDKSSDMPTSSHRTAYWSHEK
jgi:IS5 family transposase